MIFATAIIFDSADCDAVSETLAAKFIVHLHERQAQAERNLVDEIYEAQHGACETCETTRIEVRPDIDPGVVRVAPCRECRKGDFAAYMCRLALDAEEQCPDTERST